MNNLVKKLLELIITEKPSEDAILQLALLVERSNRIKKDKSEYQLNLPPDLLKIDLSISQQEEIVTLLLKHLDRNIVNPSLMWIIGKAHPQILAELVQMWVLEHYQSLDTKTLHQSLAALQNIFVSDEPEDYKTINPKLRFPDLLIMVRMLSNSTDESVAYQADNLRRTLDWHTMSMKKSDIND